MIVKWAELKVCSMSDAIYVKVPRSKCVCFHCVYSCESRWTEMTWWTHGFALLYELLSVQSQLEVVKSVLDFTAKGKKRAEFHPCLSVCNVRICVWWCVLVLISGYWCWVMVNICAWQCVLDLISVYQCSSVCVWCLFVLNSEYWCFSVCISIFWCASVFILMFISVYRCVLVFVWVCVYWCLCL